MNFAATPSTRELIDALRVVGGVLGEGACYSTGSRFHFRLDGPWTLAVSAYSGQRFRLEACHRGVPRATLMCLAGDRERLKPLAGASRAEALALV